MYTAKIEIVENGEHLLANNNFCIDGKCKDQN